ncbi:MAG: hypothetical protein QME05_04620 [Candidatus Margulisbacteria bacterium]|nr:hypothetical protein [Candidatus Margulisiibacteriota bacterium]
MDISRIIAALNSSFTQICPLVVKVIVVLVLFLAGFLAAKAVGLIVSFILRLLQLDLLAKKVGFEELLEKADVKKPISELLGNLAYWALVFILFIGVLGYFRLPVQPVLLKIFSYMGIVCLAAFILAVGVFLAGLIAGIVRVIMSNLGMEGAKTVSRIIYYTVVIFAFLTALSELGISSSVFIPQIGVIIGAVGLAAAIAFGLGCKDMAADFLFNLFRGK